MHMHNITTDVTTIKYLKCMVLFPVTSNLLIQVTINEICKILFEEICKLAAMFLVCYLPV